MHNAAQPTPPAASSPSILSNTPAGPQGGAAIQGERTLWSATRDKKAPEKRAKVAVATATPSTTAGGLASRASGPGGPPAPSPGASTPAKSKAIGPHNPLRQTLRALGSLAAHSSGEGSNKERLHSKRGGASTLFEPEQVRGFHRPGKHVLSLTRRYVPSLQDLTAHSPSPPPPPFPPGPVDAAPNLPLPLVLTYRSRRCYWTAPSPSIGCGKTCRASRPGLNRELSHSSWGQGCPPPPALQPSQ